MKNKPASSFNNYPKTIVETYKNGKPLKDFVPPIYSDIRKMNNLLKNESFAFNYKKDTEYLFSPSENFPDWPSEEEIEKFNSEEIKFHWEKFYDPSHDSLTIPYSLMQEGQEDIIWKRPSEYIIDYYLTKEIASRYPLKNITKFKKLIYDVYHHTECPTDHKKKKKTHHSDILNKLENKFDYTSENKRLMKTFFKIFDKNDFYIIKHREKDEEALNSDEDSEKNSNSKTMKKDDNHNQETSSSLYFKSSNGKLKTFCPRKIQIDERACFFTKWISSILQFIKEFDIYDDCDEPIWKKIYPQINDIPFYNPNGRYWVKLNFMGKPRKIEIDDRMPCNRKMDPLFPRCQQLEELWPAIITKAILKLFSYKISSLQTQECIIGDTQIIHALTGYYGEIVKMQNNESLINYDTKNYFKKIEITNLENTSDLQKEKEKNFILFFNYPSAFKELENSDHITHNTIEHKKPGTFTNKHLPNIKVDILKNPLNIDTDEILLKEFNIRRSMVNKQSEKKRQEELMQRLGADASDINEFSLQLSKKKSIFCENFNFNMHKKANDAFNKIFNSVDNEKKFEIHDFDNLKSITKSNTFNENFDKTLSQKYPEFLDLLKSNMKLNSGKDRKFIDFNELEKITENANEYFLDKKERKLSNINKNQNFNSFKKSLNNNSNTFVYDNINSKIIYNNDISPIFHPESGESLIKTNLNPIFNNLNGEYNSPQKLNFNLSSNGNNTITKNNYQNSHNKSTSEIYLRSSFKQKTSIKNPNSFRLGIDKRGSIISEISKSFRTTGGKLSYQVKLPNNIFFGFCYPIVEAIDTRDFNLKRLKSIDLNDLKYSLIDAKNVYKKLSKEDKKNYVQTIIDLGNKFKETKEKRISEIKAKGKNYFLFKLANNFNEGLPLNIYCEFTDEDIDVIIKCLVNDWDFPSFDYYEKLAHHAKSNEIENVNVKSNQNFISLIQDPQENRQFQLSSIPETNKRTGNIRKKSEEEKDGLGSKIINPHLANLNKTNNNVGFFNRANSIISEKSELNEYNGNINSNTSHKGLLEPRKKNSNILSSNLNLKKGLSTLNIFDELTHMISDEFLKHMYDDLIMDQREKYRFQKIPNRKKIKGQWIELDDMSKSFDYFIYLFKNSNLKVKNNYDLNWYQVTSDLYNFDKDHRIYLINLKKQIDNENNLSPIQNPLANDKKKQGTTKNLISVNIQSINASAKTNNDILERNEVNNNLNKISKILIEFSSSNTKNKMINDIKNFIIFDIYEISDTDSNENNLSIQSPLMNEHKSHEKSFYSGNDKIISNNTNKKMKCIVENQQLTGFYDIYYKEILKFEKEYLIFIKSSFTPLGYNFKILTELGTVEPMSYDRYLIEYGGMKLTNSVKYTIPSLPSGVAFLIGKFSLRFNNNVGTNSNSTINNMANFINHLNRDLIRIKFILNSQELNLIPFMNLYLTKNMPQTNSIEGNGDNRSNRIFNENKIVPINNIINLNLNDYEINDELIFSLIMKTPNDISEFPLNAEILTCSPDSIIISNIEMINPYEINDSVIIDKKYTIFKEICYVPDKIHATFYINIKRKKGNPKLSLKLNSKLESLKEVDENQNELNSSKDSGINASDSGFQNYDQTSDFKNNNISNKIRCILKIFKKEEIIYEIHFYNDILIPNILLEGMLIPQDIININNNNNSAKKGKDSLQPTEKIDYSKILSHYKMICYLDESEIPKSLLDQKEFEWKINVFASETIGFIKDTTKEDAEKALVQSWEVAYPGRADKAQKARVKYVDERISLIDTYLDLNSPIKNSQSRSKTRLEPIDNSKIKIASKDLISNPLENKVPTIFENLKHKRNLSHNILNINKEQSILLKSPDMIHHKNKSINSNFLIFREEINQSHLRSDNNILSNIRNNNSNDFSMNNEYYNKNNNNGKLNKSISSSLLMEENILLLNEKLRAASEFYNKNKSNNNEKNKIETDETSFENLNLNHVQNENQSQNSNDYKTHISKYIKKFLNQAHDKQDVDSFDVFQMQNCKINSMKLLNDAHKNSFSISKNNSKNLESYELKRKNFYSKLLKNDSEKLKTYYDKLSMKHKFRKDQSQKVFDARNTFMSNFNDNFVKENQLYDEISTNFDINNISNYINLYNNLVNSHPLKTSSTLVAIHKIISNIKDQLFTISLEKKEIKTKEQANEALIDIKLNNWIISEKTINALINISNTYQF